jgi:hypothetical protein
MRIANSQLAVPVGDAPLPVDELGDLFDLIGVMQPEGAGATVY